MSDLIEKLAGSGRAVDAKSDFKSYAGVEILSLGIAKEYTGKESGKTVTKTAVRIKGSEETFYVFSDSIYNEPEFIASSGVKATLLIKPNDYTDKDGNEVKSFSIRKLTFETTKGLTDHDLEKLSKFGISIKL